MNPSFAKNDLEMFYKYLDKASVYLEFGSGGSTYQASLKPNIKKIISVESDKLWYELVKKNVKHNNFCYHLIDLKCEPNKWGYPSGICDKNIYKKYSDIANSLNKDVSNKIDLILIDGRFRVACALKCHKIMNNNCYLVFDDFLNRKYYHIILNYFSIVEKTQDERMVILKKKNISIPIDIIKKFENVPN